MEICIEATIRRQIHGVDGAHRLLEASGHGGRQVIHYSCDRCKRIIDSQDELRFVVRIEVQGAMDMNEAEDDHDDRDHLLEVHEILETMDDLEDDVEAEEFFQQLKFDLCPECYRQFMKAPVGKEATVEFNFSQN